MALPIRGNCWSAASGKAARPARDSFGLLSGSATDAAAAPRSRLIERWISLR